jgi:addiction module HigA family antidote
MPTKSRAKTTIDGPASVLALKRPPTHPGEMLLEEFLKPAELTQVDAARQMGIPLNRLNELVRGKRGVTADTALRLARLLGTSAELWLGLQNDWDLWHAAQALRKAG